MEYALFERDVFLPFALPVIITPSRGFLLFLVYIPILVLIYCLTNFVSPLFRLSSDLLLFRSCRISLLGKVVLVFCFFVSYLDFKS